MFTVNATTGQLDFKAAPNFEIPGDKDANNSYLVSVKVENGKGGSDSQLVTVSVTNVNEVPSITSDGGAATASLARPENSLPVTTVAASDVDAGTVFTYSITGGTDQTSFTI